MSSDPEWNETESVELAGASEAAPGATFAGRYQIEREIGRGGFGSVYRAVEIGVDRPVALKVLREERPGVIERARFRREAELAKRLSHPNTVRLLDFGEDARGTPFIAYELLEGRSLAALLRAEGPLAPERAAKIASQVLKSLMEAHQLGIVHRDIKPANVFLCDFAGESEFVKLLDFGIGRDVESAMTALTATGVVLGTPRYMAPEQLRGEPPDPKMDLFAAGMTLAEMIEGQAPYQGSAMDVCRAVLSDDDVPLGPRVIGSPLRSAIARALAKDPHVRFASAEQMLAALSQPPLVTAAAAPWRRFPIALASVLGMGAVLVVVSAAVVGAVLLFGAGSAVVAPSKPLWVDAESIPTRLRERGWSEVRLEKSEKEIRISGVAAERQATVLRMNGKSEPAAELLEKLYAKQGYAIARHNTSLCAVRVQRVGAGTDPAASRALLGELH
jgi:serine/threonine-protein kinase